MRRAAILAVLVALLSACDSSSSTKSTATTSNGASGNHASAAAAATAAEAAATEAAKKHRDTVSTGIVVHQPLHGTGGAEINDDNPGNADAGNATSTGQSNPCELVSQAQAQTILGKPVDAPQEAPLGPTCIYQPVGSRTFVTLALETVDFAQIKPHIHHRTQIKVAGRTGYCGVYGQPTTFVPLADGKVLNVTAPCKIGTLFSATALSRLNSGA